MSSSFEPSPERLPSPESWNQLAVIEYDPDDGSKLEWPQANEDYFNHTSRYEIRNTRLARLARNDAKYLMTVPTESKDGESVRLCYQSDDNQNFSNPSAKRYFLVGGDVNHSAWLISFGFDELVATTSMHVDVMRAGMRYRLVNGNHQFDEGTDRKEIDYDDAPVSIDLNKSIRVYGLMKPEPTEQTVTTLAPNDSPTDALRIPKLPVEHWDILTAPLPEDLTLQQTERRAAQYFEASVEAIFSHVAHNADKYPSATQFEADGNPAAIHLPAIMMNDKFYQVSTSSSQMGTLVKLQRVQPGTKSDSIGDAIGRMSLDEFNALLNKPEELEKVFNEALSEGQLMLLQTPASEVMVIGGDLFDRRLEAKDAPYLSVVHKTTELLKTYIDEVERLPDNIETLLDKRRALTQQILASKALELTQKETTFGSNLKYSILYIRKAMFGR